MAWDAISVNGIRPWFLRLCDEGVVDDCSFSFYANDQPEGSALVLGGYDPKYAAGDITYHPILSETYWPVDCNTIIAGDAIFTGLESAIIDTGTSLIIGAYDLIISIGLALDIKFTPIINQAYVDCDRIPTLPPLTFIFEDEEYVLEGKDYILKIEEDGQS